MAGGYWSPLSNAVADGPTITLLGAVTCIPVTAKYTFAPNSIGVGTELTIRAWGRISCVVTTPGTARFDVRLGGTVVFDTGALSLNLIAKTTLPWRLDIDLTCRSIGSGTAATFMGFAQFQTEAYIASPIETTGPAVGNPIIGAGTAGGPDGAPVVGAGFDSTIANTFDMFFTQTVSTGSFTVHKFRLDSGSPALA